MWIITVPKSQVIEGIKRDDSCRVLSVGTAINYIYWEYPGRLPFKSVPLLVGTEAEMLSTGWSQKSRAIKGWDRMEVYVGPCVWVPGSGCSQGQSGVSKGHVACGHLHIE